MCWFQGFAPRCVDGCEASRECCREGLLVPQCGPSLNWQWGPHLRSCLPRHSSPALWKNAPKIPLTPVSLSFGECCHTHSEAQRQTCTDEFAGLLTRARFKDGLRECGLDSV